MPVVPSEVTAQLDALQRQVELLNDDRFVPTPYAAHQGWVSLTVDSATDWAEVAGLVREAYRQVALQRMLRALDAQEDSPAGEG